MKIQIIAHRGCSAKAPENSRGAFEEAQRIQVDFIESDVQMSRDGIPFIFHDDNFFRITQGKIGNKVNTLTFSEIMEIGIGSWFADEFGDEKPLSLREFLEFATADIGIMLDLKEETITSKNHLLTIAKVIQEYSSTNVNHGPILVGSLKKELLIDLQSLFPSKQLLPIIENEDQIQDFENFGAKIFAIDESIVTPEIITHLKTHDIETWVWVVDNPERALELVEEGVKGIITNNPEKMMEQLKL